MTEKTLIPTVDAEVRCVRERVGLWLRDTHTFIRITGPDTASWLQTQTSNDVLVLESGDGHANTLLDRKARLQAHFTLHRWEDEYWLIVERDQAPHLLETLDQHLFLEEVTIEDNGDTVDQFFVQGPRATALLASALDTAEAIGSDYLPNADFGCHPLELLGHEVLAFRLSDSGEDGFLLVTEGGHGQAILDALLDAGESFAPSVIGPEAQEILRIEAGIPRFGVDMNRENRLPETTLERDAVSYEKGCYLGQEVVAKLRTYSTVRRALMGIAFIRDASGAPKLGDTLLVDGKPVGEMRSATFSPTLGYLIGMAYLDRDHRDPGSELTCTCESLPEEIIATVRVLPIYQAERREDRAHRLYDEALAVFEQDQDDQDASAIDRLRECILLEPTFEDAYEALGVILHRHHRVDEAIHYMKKLEALNPDCLMAHTNLSVFYMTKGMIEEAEQEKAKAAVLQIQHTRDARNADEIAAAERERIRSEAQERIGMFEEVLEIDPDDALATYGMGAAHMQLSDYEKAVPYLKRATELQQDYSVAFLNLGKCLEFIGQTEIAKETYRSGIAAANRKGDLMPMREMERRLQAIESP
jgi:folate-binding protein YgfZ